MTIDNTTERYIGFVTDYAFKRFFGTEANKDLLIDFLNSLFEGKELIKDISYKNGEYIPEKFADRKAVFDVFCTNDKGEHFIVEMQNAKQDYFKDRTIFYSSLAIHSQSQKGKSWNFRIQRVYSVNIMNFKFDDVEPSDLLKKKNICRTNAQIFDTETCKLFYDKLNFIYIELPRFTKTAEELETQFDRWIYAIKYISTFKGQPPELAGKVFERLFQIAEIALFTNQEVFEYQESLKEFRDYENTLNYRFMEGKQEGLQEGARQNALRMLSKGYPIEDIADITGLSINEIKSL